LTVVTGNESDYGNFAERGQLAGSMSGADSLTVWAERANPGKKKESIEWYRR
jgi:hypothetical protein